MSPWLQYLIAFFVVCHGSIYIALPFVPDTLRVWGGRSWLLDRALTGDRLWAVLVAIHVGAGVALLASAAAMAFPTWVPGWWRPLAIAGGALGLAAFAVF